MNFDGIDQSIGWRGKLFYWWQMYDSLTGYRYFNTIDYFTIHGIEINTDKEIIF